MGRKSRDKRRRHAAREAEAWYCLQCHARMHRELAPAAQKLVEERSVVPCQPTEILHVCGICQALHRNDGGRLRRLTAAEEFGIRMKIPNALAQIENVRYGPESTEAGTILFVDEETT